MELELHFRVLFIFSDFNQDSSSCAAFRSANSLESLDFVTNSIQQARANSLSSTASSLKYFNGLNSQCNVSASQCDQKSLKDHNAYRFHTAKATLFSQFPSLINNHENAGTNFLHRCVRTYQRFVELFATEQARSVIFQKLNFPVIGHSTVAVLSLLSLI